MVKRWQSFSASKEHILARQYMLAAALKAIMLTSFGDYFKSDKQIIEFEEAYDVVSLLNNFCPKDLYWILEGVIFDMYYQGNHQLLLRGFNSISKAN